MNGPKPILTSQPPGMKPAESMDNPEDSRRVGRYVTPMRKTGGIIGLMLIAGAAGCSSSGGPSAPAALSASAPALADSPRAVAGITGFVVDTGYRIVEGARIEVLDGPQAGASTTVDAAGQFSLAGTFDATTRFRATRDGYVTAVRTWNCSVGTCSGPSNARPWVGFYLDVVTPPVNIAGDYALTFIADAACTDLPSELRTRTYAARIAPAPGANPSAPSSYTVTVSGGSFLGALAEFPIGVAGDYVAPWLHGGHDPAIVEQLAPATYLAFSGNAAVSLGAPPSSTISAPFAGWIDHCVMPTPMRGGYNCGTSNITGEPISGASLTHIRCESTQHRLILVRR